VAGEDGWAAEGVDRGVAALAGSAFVGLDALLEAQVAAAEDFDGDAELAGDGAGALHGALGAAGLEARVFDVDGDPAAGVVVGVHGVDGQDPGEGVGGDVVAAQHVAATGDRGG
jgi:hypothetical protein